MDCHACKASLIYGCVYYCVEKGCGDTYCTDCVHRGKWSTRDCKHRLEVISLKKGIAYTVIKID